ncbi:MAG: glycosyltransferase family 39 protein [Thermoguttaceae bacterium]|nr:glycosyltransferase family 39 protein [Thermoguttaceae bacterium]MDW8038071.1 glycosyltransferase family 39 protein [Thermoguttaceae bacterium]
MNSGNTPSNVWYLGGILLASGMVFFVSLGTPALWDEDEPLYASIAVDMYQRADWVVPRYNGQLFAEKPPLAYWLMMLGYHLLGINEWAVRVPSALFGIGTGWVVYFLGRRLFNAQVGFWAALATTTNIIFTVSARAATTDSVFVFFTTLGIYCFVASGLFGMNIRSCSFATSESPETSTQELRLAGATPPETKTPDGYLSEGDGASAGLADARPWPAQSSWWALAGMYACFSMAVLAKGPIGLLLPVGMLGVFLLIRRQWESADRWWADRRTWLLERFPRPQETDFLRPGWQMKTLGALLLSWLVGLAALARTFRPKRLLQTFWQLRPITGLALCTLIAVPWYVLVGLQTDGQFLWQFFWEQNVLRTMKPMQGHSGPFWYYIPAILVGFFPWSIFLGPALVELVRGIRMPKPDQAAGPSQAAKEHENDHNLRRLKVHNTPLSLQESATEKGIGNVPAMASVSESPAPISQSNERTELHPATQLCSPCCGRPRLAEQDSFSDYRASCTFVLCWIAVFVLAWSVPRTKLPHYVLTAYPALGLMTGWFIQRWLERPERVARFWMRLAMASLVVVGIGLAVGFPIAAHLFTPGEEWLGLLGLLLPAGAGIFVYLTRRNRCRLAMSSFALMAVVFLVGIFGLAAVRIDRFQEARPLMAQLRQLAGEDFQLAGYQFIRESFVFYAGRPIPYLEKPEQLEAFLQQSARPFVLSTNKQEGELRERFGQQLRVIARRARFLRRGEILLWGRPESTSTSLGNRSEDLAR